MGILRHPLPWTGVLAAGLMAFTITFSYLGGFLDPAGNTKGLPLAIVNEDAGSDVNGQPLNLGQQVIEEATVPGGSLGDDVEWSVVASRDEVIDQMKSDRYYAAMIIPSDYTTRILALQTPSGSPLEAARIEILANPASGSIASAAAQQIVQGVVAQIQAEVLTRTVQSLTSAGANLSAQQAVVIAQPVQAETTTVVPLGNESARGLAPFYFAVMLTLAGFVGTNIVNIAVDITAGRAEVDLLGKRLRLRDRQTTWGGLFTAKLTLSLAMSVLSAVLLTAMAVPILGMDATDPWKLALFAVLGVTAVSMVTLLFVTTLGNFGVLLGILVTTIFGVPSAGGVYPQEMMPRFFQLLGDVLPLRYLTDGSRSLIFFEGRLDAGLETALWALGLYAAAAAALGYAAAFAFDGSWARWATASRRERGSSARPGEGWPGQKNSEVERSL